MDAPESYIRSYIKTMPGYEPILPFEVVSDALGLPIEKIIKLDANENPYGPLPEVRQTLTELPFIHIYPDPESRVLRQAIADYHHLPVENILAGAGADELLDLLMRAFLEPGEAILNCPPTFGMYAFDAEVNRARVISVPRRSDFSLDVEAIARAIHRERPKLAFIASPNNPDGSLIPEEVLNRLLSLPVMVILDEAYIEFAPPETSRMRAVLTHPNLVVLRTFSKWAGLAGLRVGYGVFPSWLIAHLWKIKQPYNVSVAASAAAVASLRHAGKLLEICQLLLAERERLFRALQSIPWLYPYPSQANFILCRVTGLPAQAVKQALAQAGILVRYFDKPGLQDHIRISVGKPEHTDALITELERIGAAEDLTD